MNWKNILSTAASAFGGGAAGYFGTHLSGGLPSNAQQWEAAIAGAALAGLVAVYHLYQPAPAAAPQAKP